MNNSVTIEHGTTENTNNKITNFFYEMFALFINAVMLVDIVRLVISAQAADIVRNILYIFLLLYALWHAIQNRKILVLLIPATTFGALVLCSMLLNNRLQSLIVYGVLIFFSRCLVAFYFAYNMDNPPLLLEKLKKYFAVALLYCIIYIVMSSAEDFEMGGTYMTFAYNILTIAIISLCLFVEKPTIIRGILAASFVLCILILGARGAVVCLIISLLLFLYRGFRAQTIKTKLAILLLIVIGILLIVLCSGAIIDALLLIAPESRTLALIKSGEFFVSEGRNETYEMILSEVNQNWVRPHGLYADRLLSGTGSEGDYAHNLIIELMYQFGPILGVLLCVLLLVLIVKSYGIVLFRETGADLILYVAFSSGLSTLLFSSSYLINERSWLSIGLIVALCIRQRKEKQLAALALDAEAQEERDDS